MYFLSSLEAIDESNLFLEDNHPLARLLSLKKGKSRSILKVFLLYILSIIYLYLNTESNGNFMGHEQNEEEAIFPSQMARIWDKSDQLEIRDQYNIRNR